MGNRIFVGIVVLLWTGTMSWLMVARILPPFFQGEPPTHGVLLRDEPVCWEIEYEGRTIGHAVSQAVAGALDTTEIHSRVLFEGVEIRELAPQWMGSIVNGLGEVSLDVRTIVVLDSIGNLSSFNTKVHLNDLPLVMKVQGRVDGAELKLKIQSGEATHEVVYPVPSYSLLTSELSPDPKMLQVYVGRKWQQEIYSPFRPPGNSLEMLEATVVDERYLDHRGERVRARKIEYRTMSPAGVAVDNTLRAVVWVGDDGTVLRQDLHLMDAKLRFERCEEPYMLKLAEEMLDLKSVATMSPAAHAVMIEFEQVCRAYGEKVAVDNLNLRINSGDLYALLGHNGAGKTTAIKMLVGLIRPGSGAVRVGGYDLVTNTREATALIGYVPDQPFLYDKLTGAEILQFIGRMYGMDIRQTARAIEREIERFELTDFVNELTETYSHGMKQRTVFASAMLHDPRVLVVDEPMVGLDPHSMRLVKDLLQREVNRGMCVLMSTHTLPAAEEIANRVGIMSHAQLLFDGTVEALREKFPGERRSLETMYLALTEDNGKAE